MHDVAKLFVGIVSGLWGSSGQVLRLVVSEWLYDKTRRGLHWQQRKCALASEVTSGRSLLDVSTARSNVFQMTAAGQNDQSEQQVLHVGQRIFASGIYRAHHVDHRPPHEVTLLRNEVFPPCAKCGDGVRFELVRTVPGLEDLDFHVKLFRIPDDEAEAA